MNTTSLPHANVPLRVLITGGAGFIGSHLAEALLQQGHHVTIIDDLSTGRFENIEPLVSQWASHNGNATFNFVIDTLTNEVVLDRLVSECDVIFHLAAAVGVQLIVSKPVHTIETNVMGTEAVLKAALRYRAKVLIASTSEVYGKGLRIPFSEDDDVVLGPTLRHRWAYAASKMLDEFLGLAYYREEGLPVTIFRLFNTVGPGQRGRYGMVLPRFVRQALDGDSLTVYGDGQQSRCFLHVRDAVTAITGLAECSSAVAKVFNIGSTEEVTILELAQRVLHHCAELSGISSDDIRFVSYEQAYAASFEDMQRRVPSVDRIREYIGWAPQRSLDETIRDVITHEISKEVVTQS